MKKYFLLFCVLFSGVLFADNLITVTNERFFISKAEATHKDPLDDQKHPDHLHEDHYKWCEEIEDNFRNKKGRMFLVGPLNSYTAKS